MLELLDNDMVRLAVWNDIRRNGVSFFVDNQAVLLALNKEVAGTTMIEETKLLLNDLASHFPVDLRWVKAHSGYEGNEIVDQHAKESTVDNIEGPYPVLPLPWSTRKRMVTQFIEDEWQQRWSSMTP